jgi:antitoxin VapB
MVIARRSNRMTININNMNVEKLLDEITQITGESRTEAVRKALEERRHRLTRQTAMTRGDAGLLAFLQEEVWPQIPSAHLGVRLTKEEEEQILGYGEQGA